MKMNNTRDCDSGRLKRTVTTTTIRIEMAVAVCDVGVLILDHFETYCEYNIMTDF
jgi:hypothetical protein